MPSSFAAQLRQRSFSGIGDRYAPSNSYSDSRSSKIFRNSNQVNCEIRCASPSTPASCRIISCIAFIVVEIDINFPYSLSPKFRSPAPHSFAGLEFGGRTGLKCSFRSLQTRKTLQRFRIQFTVDTLATKHIDHFLIFDQ